MANRGQGTAGAALVVKRLGRDCGFDLVRISEATLMHRERLEYLRWLDEGRHGEMGWMTQERAIASTDPDRLQPGARSVISVGVAYWAGHRPPTPSGHGDIARYAWGGDYHAVLGSRLRDLALRLTDQLGGGHRWYVDTGPTMDKAFARRSGLGWYGKNTNILTERYGSYVLLGEIITTLPLTADRSLDKTCGSCTLCVVACPTGALDGDYRIDARRCISYLTIEHRDPIPVELRRAIGTWVFGCDICQDVCPPTMKPHLMSEGAYRSWAHGVRNTVRRRDQGDAVGSHESARGHRMEPGTTDQFGRPVRRTLDLVWLLQLTHAEYVNAFRGSSVKRAKVWMLRRNAAVALGNVGDERAIAGLARALESDDHPQVRGHAAWAIGEIAARSAGRGWDRALERRLRDEGDRYVCEEIRGALLRAKEVRATEAVSV